MTRLQYTLQSFGLSDPGLCRPKNEDALIIADLTCQRISGQADQSMGTYGTLLAVADGLGGYRGGDIASHLALQTMTQALFDMGVIAIPPIEQLSRAIEAAHASVCARQQAHLLYAEMASTLTAVHASPSLLTVAQIGDSRAYLFRDQELTLLTEDQTLVQQLQRQGVLTAEEASKHPNKHVILQAIGQDRPVLPEVYLTPWQPGDCVLLCTDGLSSFVSHEDIEDLLVTATDLPTTCHRLIDAAKRAGGGDNITVILARLATVSGGNLHGRTGEANAGDTL